MEDAFNTFVDTFTQPGDGSKVKCLICLENGKSEALSKFNSKDRAMKHIESIHFEVFQFFIQLCEEDQTSASPAEVMSRVREEVTAFASFLAVAEKPKKKKRGFFRKR